MESLSLTTTTNTSKFRFPVPCYKNPKIYKNVGFRHKRCRKFVLFASANKDDEKFDGYDQMEMKFGRMIGEDPKLTLAKIIGRKTNPELSSLEIEKLYNKKGMKAFTDIEEVPFDVSDIRKKRNDSLDGVNLTRPIPKKGVKFETNDSLDGLNLARPVPKKGVKFEANNSLEGLNLTRPAPKKGVRFEKTDPLNGLNLTRPAPKKGVQLERSGDKSVIPEVKRPNQTLSMAPNTPSPSVTNVELRKPTTFEEDDEGLIAMFQKPNLSYKVNREQEKERVTDMTMVRKPAPFLEKEDVEEPVSTEESLSEIQTDAALLQKPEPFVQNDDVEEAVNDSTEESLSEIQTDAALLQKPEPFVQNDDVEEAVNDEENLSEIQTDFSLLKKPIISVDQASRDENESNSEIEDIKKSSEGVNIAFEMENGDVLKLQEASLAESQPSENTDKGFVETGSDPDISATLRGPPKRLDQTVNNTSKIEKEVTGPVNPVPYDNASDTKNLPTPPLLQDREDTDWKRAQDLIKTEGREEVELINSSTRGFVASFGSLIGFLPYRNLATKWKWSDDYYKWNETLFNVVAPDLRSSCSNLSCLSYYKEEPASLCTMLSNRTASLVADRCNISRASICMLVVENRCQHMHCHREYLIILAIVSGLILFTTFAVVIWLLVFKRSKRRRKSRKLSNPAELALVSPSWKIFTREELKSITKNFSEGNRLIGDAKTGGTYSGLLPDGSRVAVKRLKRSTFQRKKEFYSEIGRVARLCHENLVPVKGCCYDHGDRYIVYEYVVHGPLDRWLHHIPMGGRTLDWSMRMKVATTLAQGIAFLHDKVKPQVVHHDIRASNVLLDEDFGAHLMGVGLSKFVPWEVMHGRTVMAGGTHGYLAPEFVYRNEQTTKSDVYSFGVLLLEIISGRRPASQAVDSVGWQSIFEWATPLVQSHRYLELLDPVISASSSTSPSRIPEAGVVQKVVDLVYSCTQHVPSMRPRMSHVVHQLQQLAA